MNDTVRSATPPSTSGNAWPILLTVTLASFTVPFTSSSVNVALPAIGREFAMDAVTLGWVATGFLLAGAVFQLPFGRLGDIYGRRRFFLVGVSVFTLASLALVFAPTWPVVIQIGRAHV